MKTANENIHYFTTQKQAIAFFDKTRERSQLLKNSETNKRTGITTVAYFVEINITSKMLKDGETALQQWPDKYILISSTPITI